MDPLIHHSHVCSKPFINNTAPLRVNSGAQEAASCSCTCKESSIRNPGMIMGLYLLVQWHKSQESKVCNAVFSIKAFYLRSVLVNPW